MNITAIHSVGPLDGRHAIIVPDMQDRDDAEALAQTLSDHFIEAWKAMHPGEEVNVAAVVPLIVFGPDVRFAADETLRQTVELYVAHTENLIERMHQLECEHEHTSIEVAPDESTEYVVCNECRKVIR